MKAVEWAPMTVGEDLRSLIVCFRSAPSQYGKPVVSVREADDVLAIHIEVPDPRKAGGDAIPLVLVRGAETVAFEKAIDGRCICGRGGSRCWKGATYRGRWPDDTWGQLVPRVKDLNPEDAARLIRGQGLRPECAEKRGRKVIAQDPSPDVPIQPGATIRLTLGT